MQYAFEKLHYGFFVHYVAGYARYSDGTPARSIDEAADGFDVHGFADDLERMGVEYLIFTAWHSGARPLYPSGVMEKWRPGNCSKRDLVGEIIDATAAKGIKTVLYTHPRVGHDMADEDRIRTGWGLGCEEGEPETPDPHNFDYAKWNTFVLSLYEELMERYAQRIIGLYIDGMGPGRFAGGTLGSQSYEYPIIDYMQIRRIVKAANPGIALIQNYFGYRFTCDFVIPEGFFGYENMAETNVWPACAKALAMARFGEWWANAAKGPNVARISPEDALRFTIFQSTCSIAGGVAWAAGPYCGGGWPRGVLETMREAGHYMKSLGNSIDNVSPSGSWPTISGDTMETRGYVVSCSSRDRLYEYIHILKRPENSAVALPAPLDGAGFSDPVVITGNASVIEFAQSGDGIRFRLVGEWDEPDTVVRLSRRNNPHVPVIEWRNDTDIRISYFGEWIYEYLSGGDPYNHNRFHGCYEYDTHATRRDGDWWKTVFEGDTVEVVGPVGPDGGKADVLVDEIKLGEIDANAPERMNRQILFSSGPLYGGLHTIRVIKTGGRTLEMDAIRITRLQYKNSTLPQSCIATSNK